MAKLGEGSTASESNMTRIDEKETFREPWEIGCLIRRLFELVAGQQTAVGAEMISVHARYTNADVFSVDVVMQFSPSQSPQMKTYSINCKGDEVPRHIKRPPSID